VDPCCAVIEAWDPRRYDEIIVSTLPDRSSRWLQMGLPQRIARAVDAPVHHLISRPARAHLSA
jgi:GABA permease